MKILLILWPLLFSSILHATQQIPDALKYEGKEYSIEQVPLSSIMDGETIIAVVCVLLVGVDMKRHGKLSNGYSI